MDDRVSKTCVFWCDISRVSYSTDDINLCKKLINKDFPYYSHEIDLIRHVTGILLAQWAINNYYEDSVKRKKYYSEQISVDKDCKPFYLNNSNLHFNISHSGNIVLCGVSNFEIGVDIEMISKSISKVINRFFSQDEIVWSMEENSLSREYRLWTLKESFLKCTGQGIKSIGNSISMVDENRLINNYQSYYFRPLFIKKGYVSSLCTEGIIDKLFIEEVEMTCLEKMMKSFC